MEWHTYIGLAAGIITTLSTVPQLIKSLISKKTRDLSFLYYLQLFIGIFLWALYGCLIRDVPLILANCVSLCMVGAILFVKMKYDRSE